MLNALDVAFSKVKGLEAIVEKMGTDLDLSRNSESQLVGQLRKIEEKYNELNKSNSQLYRQYDEKCEEFSQSMKELKEVNDKYDAVLIQLTNQDRLLDTDVRLLDELNLSLKIMKYELENEKSQHQETRSFEKEYKTEIEELKQDLDWIRSEKQKLLDNWNEAEHSLTMTIDSLNHKVFDLKEELQLEKQWNIKKAELDSSTKAELEVDWGLIFFCSVIGFIIGLLL